MPNKPYVQLNEVHKRFGDRKVINGINLNIQSKEVVALLGVNGAGKTTLINMMLGLEKPTSGEVSLFNQDPSLPRSREKIGATPQNSVFPEHLKVSEILELVKNHYPNPMSIEQTAQDFGLLDLLDQKAGGLSGGQKRRIAIALAFIGKPQCVFLDEPTTGLDVESRQQIWKSVKKFIAQGGTVFLTTHYLEEAEALATRILIIDDGVIKVEGSTQEIKAIAGRSRVCFESNAELPHYQHSHSVEKEGNQYTLSTDHSDELVKEIVKSGIDFSHLQILENNLETAYLSLIQDKKLTLGKSA